MKEILASILFGILEGITEWLPVSSTGHLILLRRFLPPVFDDSFFEVFEVIVQWGAIAAVLVVFWHTLWPFGRNRAAEERRETLSLWGKILIAVLPAAILGFLFDDTIDRLFFNSVTVAIALIFYGILYLFPFGRKTQEPLCSDGGTVRLSARSALLIGCFQVLSLIPGTSRSGATILGGLVAGLSRTEAAQFSFFLGLPTMAGAGLLKTAKYLAAGGSFSPGELICLLIGTLTAFLTSLVVIRYLLSFVRNHSFFAFGIYRILLGGAVLLTVFL